MGPKQVIQGESSEPNRNSKRSVQEATEPQRPEATTIGPWWGVHGRATWTHDREFPLAHEFLHFPARLFIFHAFFSLSFCFGFKRELNLAYLRGRIHSKNSQKNSQNSIGEVEGRRRGIRRRQRWKRIDRSTFYPSISFLISFSFF